jgi:hypothetical protein
MPNNDIENRLKKLSLCRVFTSNALFVSVCLNNRHFPCVLQFVLVRYPKISVQLSHQLINGQYG